MLMRTGSQIERSWSRKGPVWVDRGKSKVEFDSSAVCCDPTALLAHRINFTPILLPCVIGYRPACDISRNIATHLADIDSVLLNIGHISRMPMRMCVQFDKHGTRMAEDLETFVDSRSSVQRNSGHASGRNATSRSS